VRVAWLIYGDINQITGGYLYDKYIIEYLRRQEYDVDIISIPQLPRFLNTIWNLWLPWRLHLKSYDLIVEDELTHSAVCLFNWWVKRRRCSRLAALVHHFSWLELQGWRQKLVRWIEKMMIGRVDFAIVSSRAIKNETIGLNYAGESVAAIHPGFNPPKGSLTSFPRPQSHFRLLFVGICIFRKGLHLLLDALAQIRNLNLHLDIVGAESREPRYVGYLKRRVSALHLEDIISFHGESNPSDIWQWYAQADIFIAPSLYEGYGIVFAEAMYFGLPVIATCVGGIPEIVEDGKTGILIPPNDVESLSRAINDLYGDSERRQFLSENAKKKAKLLPDWNETGKRFQETIEYYMEHV
jgi:glycosyltransferase involved in cell wall biosynthesis